MNVGGNLIEPQLLSWKRIRISTLIDAEISFTATLCFSYGAGVLQAARPRLHTGNSVFGFTRGGARLAEDGRRCYTVFLHYLQTSWCFYLEGCYSNKLKLSLSRDINISTPLFGYILDLEPKSNREPDNIIIMTEKESVTSITSCRCATPPGTITAADCIKLLADISE